ncbi:ParB N-terminal domain-containing protein [Streptomyces fimicarius]|uniref:ParB N-terminal domain-containing protein n=1 Tax=Streptomyces griseus TaxID=1911 RepID=UPI0036860A30
MTTDSLERPWKIILKRKSISLDEIQTDHATAERLTSIDNLSNSIRNLGLSEPLLVNPANLTLISGRRRYNACKQLRMRTVRVCMPEDVLEACTELGVHVTSPDPMYARVMNARERLDLSLRLSALRRPLHSTKGKFSHDAHVAPAVGYTTRILWRLRSTLIKARESEANPGADSLRARSALALMLEAIENPVEGYSASQLVSSLHSMLQREDVPRSLDAMSMPRNRFGRIPVENRSRQREISELSQPMPRPRATAEFRRGVDMISGALTGLESLMYLNIPTGDEAEYMGNELKKTQRTIRQMLKTLQGGVS